MGNLDLKEEKEILKFITGMLKRRGLEPDLKNEWIVHGKHRDMGYQLYIGYAIDSKGEKTLVVIYPRSVYWLDNYSDWWRCEPENRIFIGERRL